MKILGGSLRGRSLEVVPGVRPTSGRAKEALFSRWLSTVQGCSFLDLFAGSGAMGLEALSRGAETVIFVEQDRRALAAIRKNRDAVATLSSGCQVVCGELPKLPRQVVAHGPFDHVFSDPPYDFRGYGPLLKSVAGALAPEGEAAIEHSSRASLADEDSGLVLVDSRTYGESRLSFFRFDPS